MQKRSTAYLEGKSYFFYNLREDDISRLTYVLKTIIQTFQFFTIILKLFRMIVAKELDFIKGSVNRTVSRL